MIPSRSSNLYVLFAAIILSLFSQHLSTWSQTGGDPTGSSLPPLPQNNPSPRDMGDVPIYGSPAPSPSHGGYLPNNTRLGSVMVVGQSNAAATATHLMSSATLSNGSQQIVLVDPAKQTLVVYHVDPNKGDIQLKSVRRIDADFSLEEFNLSEPTPATVRKNLRNNLDR
ncbi:MAG: hypothetical protein WCI02_13620 [Planctomycetota bacterium]|jgi:hypothetical protein